MCTAPTLTLNCALSVSIETRRSLFMKSFNREEVFSEFEVLIGQLLHHTPKSKESVSALLAKLNNLAHSYCGSPIDWTDFSMHRECFQAIKSLRSNKDILITKPDKGSGGVILNSSDYIAKMETILCDSTKFICLGPVEENDNTAKLETKLQRRLLQLKKDHQITPSIYNDIRPTGSQRPRMYGLPKTHKASIPLRPILSMIGSSQHELAKWLCTILQPVLDRYSAHCIKDSFTFAKTIQDLTTDSDQTFLCSFDISSLFTNIPLKETIQICADSLYESNLTPPIMDKDVFIELMNIATTSVEFSFNNKIYKQIDGVAMGSPLGPALANIFVGYQEEKLFIDNNQPLIYFRYVDDTFAMFEDELNCNLFLKQLNSLHQSLNFTHEKEVNGKLPFLVVLVEKSNKKFLTSVYRKPSFSGQYNRWDSFGPKSRKNNLIGTLVHRALEICSPSKLPQEIDFIRSILYSNGYPENVINSRIKRKIEQFKLPPKEGPEQCPVYLKLPWIGNISTKFENQCKTAVSSCFGAVKLRVAFSTRKMLPTVRKDVVPTKQQSMVVYQYVCRCDCRYVGRTSQRLQDRIKQHIPKAIRNQAQTNCDLSQSNHTCTSAIGQHLLNNKKCAAHYDDNQFSILAKGRTLFHLSTLEATFIKMLKPELCRQKEFVYTLKLRH